MVSVMPRRTSKQKMLTALPAKFRPDFLDRLNRNYTLARVVLARREALRAHVGGNPGYVLESLISRTLWHELLVEQCEQQAANGDPVDIGRYTQLTFSLKGLYKDLGIRATAKTANVREYLNLQPVSGG